MEKNEKGLCEQTCREHRRSRNQRENGVAWNDALLKVIDLFVTRTSRSPSGRWLDAVSHEIYGIDALSIEPFARSFARSLVRSLTRSRARRKENHVDELNASVSYILSP